MRPAALRAADTRLKLKPGKQAALGSGLGGDCCKGCRQEGAITRTAGAKRQQGGIRPNMPSHREEKETVKKSDHNKHGALDKAAPGVWPEPDPDGSYGPRAFRQVFSGAQRAARRNREALFAAAARLAPRLRAAGQTSPPRRRNVKK